jgi:hypothetical protein
LLVPFSLMWGGFAVFWEVSVFRTPAPFFFRLFGVPFVLIGLYFIAGRFLVDAWLRAKTYYAVTNQRILIARSAPMGAFTALNRDRLADLQLTEEANGRGTIRFGQLSAMWGRNGFAAWTPVLDPTPQFIAIDDAARVFNVIQNAGK